MDDILQQPLLSHHPVHSIGHEVTLTLPRAYLISSNPSIYE